MTYIRVNLPDDSVFNCSYCHPYNDRDYTKCVNGCSFYTSPSQLILEVGVDPYRWELDEATNKLVKICCTCGNVEQDQAD